MVFVDLGSVEAQTLAIPDRLGQPGASLPESIAAILACRLALSPESTANLSNQWNLLLRNATAKAQRAQLAAPALQESPTTSMHRPCFFAGVPGVGLARCRRDPSATDAYQDYESAMVPSRASAFRRSGHGFGGLGAGQGQHACVGQGRGMPVRGHCSLTSIRSRARIGLAFCVRSGARFPESSPASSAAYGRASPWIVSDPPVPPGETMQDQGALARGSSCCS